MAQSKGIRRVVTAHDAAGKAIVGFDGIATVSGGEPELGVETITLWVTDGTPAGLDGTKDPRETKVGIPPPKNGSPSRSRRLLSALAQGRVPDSAKRPTPNLAPGRRSPSLGLCVIMSFIGYN